jgi:hypothetical protein
MPDARISGSERSLILGAYSRLPIQMLEPFVRSLRATGFQGRFDVFVAEYDRDQLRSLAGLADRVIPVDDDYSHAPSRFSVALGFARRQRGLRRFYPPLFKAVCRTASERDSLDRWRNLEFQLEGLQSLRYLHYYRHLTDEAVDAEVVMITDLRDVVFQRSPFADPVSGLELYLEDGSERVGQDGSFNTRWLRELYGQEFVDVRRGQPVSCSGVVVGTRSAMLTYLSEMIAGVIWRRLPMGSHDQGVHNALIQTGRLPTARLIANETGRVLTLGRMQAFRTNEDGVLLNADGSIPAVLHQWDRHASLAARLHSSPLRRAV